MKLITGFSIFRNERPSWYQCTTDGICSSTTCRFPGNDASWIPRVSAFYPYSVNVPTDSVCFCCRRMPPQGFRPGFPPAGMPPGFIPPPGMMPPGYAFFGSSSLRLNTKLRALQIPSSNATSPVGIVSGREKDLIRGGRFLDLVGIWAFEDQNDSEESPTRRCHICIILDNEHKEPTTRSTHRKATTSIERIRCSWLLRHVSLS